VAKRVDEGHSPGIWPIRIGGESVPLRCS
jgi:hypothetical protein